MFHDVKNLGNLRVLKVVLFYCQVAATSIGAYLLSWVPYATIAALGLMKPHSEAWVTPLMSEIPVMFAKASAAWNPLIYALG